MIRPLTKSSVSATNTDAHSAPNPPSNVPILDTDTLTVIQRRSEPAYTRLVSRFNASPDIRVFTTIVSFEEQTRGWLEYVKRARSPDQLIKAYSMLHELHLDFSTRPVLDFDAQAAHVYNRLLHARLRLGSMDLRIAAITLARNEILLTRNLKDFRRVPNLRAEDWTI
jgi:tRNA(fMet)-specific endonuclease VapC